MSDATPIVTNDKQAAESVAPADPATAAKAYPASAPQKSGPAGSAGVVLGPLLGAVVFGGIWHFVANNSYDLPVILPALVGAAAGAVSGFALKRAGMRLAPLVLGLGLLAGIFTVLTRHVLDAYAERPLMVAYMEKRLQVRSPDLSPAEIRSRTNAALNPAETVRQHLADSAENGILLKDAHRGSPTGAGERVGGDLFWRLIAVNAAACVLAATLAARSMASAPKPAAPESVTAE